MSLIDLAGGLYADLMLDASIGGFSFSIIDTGTDDGRRIQHVLFPGQDRIAFQDLGQHDGEISFSGLLIGDDAPHQAERLRTVFQAGGVLTLDIPFLDAAIQVVPVRGLSIKQTVEELRVARFTATVMRWLPRESPQTDTLQGILDAVADLKSQVRSWLRRILRPLGMVLSVLGYVSRLSQSLIATWHILAGSAANGLLSGLIRPFTSALGLINTLPVNASYPDAVADRLAAPSAAIAAAGVPDKQSAVAPGGLMDTAEAVDPRITTALLLQAAGTMAPANAAESGAALSVCAMAFAVADAVLAASDIPFESQQDALAWQARLNTAIDGVAALAAGFAATDPIQAGPVWQALLALRAAVAADMTATIGRLPAVRAFVPTAPVPVWVLAQHLSGDDPGRVLATYLDLIRRNDIAHPAHAPSGALEVLL